MIVNGRFIYKPFRKMRIHHIDCDRENNDPKNLMILGSQKEHMAEHKKLRDKYKIKQILMTRYSYEWISINILASFRMKGDQYDPHFCRGGV